MRGVGTLVDADAPVILIVMENRTARDVLLYGGECHTAVGFVAGEVEGVVAEVGGVFGAAAAAGKLVGDLIQN